MYAIESLSVNPLIAARQLGLASASWDVGKAPKNHQDATALMEAVRVEALGQAVYWLDELEAGRGMGSWTIEYLEDLMVIVKAIDAARVR